MVIDSEPFDLEEMRSSFLRYAEHRLKVDLWPLATAIDFVLRRVLGQDEPVAWLPVAARQSFLNNGELPGLLILRRAGADLIVVTADKAIVSQEIGSLGGAQISETFQGEGDIEASASVVTVEHKRLRGEVTHQWRDRADREQLSKTLAFLRKA